VITGELKDINDVFAELFFGIAGTVTGDTIFDNDIFCYSAVMIELWQILKDARPLIVRLGVSRGKTKASERSAWIALLVKVEGDARRTLGFVAGIIPFFQERIVDRFANEAVFYNHIIANDRIVREISRAGGRIGDGVVGGGIRFDDFIFASISIVAIAFEILKGTLPVVVGRKS